MGLFWRSENNLWSHSAIVCGTAVLILTTARTFGASGINSNVGTVFVHSIVQVIVAHSMFTLVAGTAMIALRHRFPLWLCAIGGCTVGALPCAFLAPSISYVLGVLPASAGIVETRGQFFEFWVGRLPFVYMAFATLGTLLWTLLNYHWWANHLESLSSRHRIETEPPLGEREPLETIVRKLPRNKRGRLLALSAEEHYVRVRTEVGEDLVLMPFSEAIAPLSKDLGMRIHRSHWVSAHAISKIENSGTGLKVHLRNGVELPVSRSFSGTLRETWPHLIDG